MKSSNYFRQGIILLFASLLFISCRKDFTEPLPETKSTTIQSDVSCKPAVFAAYPINDINPWVTLAQKWYSDGKIRYLKARDAGMTVTYIDPMLELGFRLEWGEVTYQGNQVYLKDVVNNRQLMRVTLDELGRPIASYLYNHWNASPDTYMHDTTYFYYNGDRLDYIISIYETRPWGTTYKGWRKYQFSYDSWGNLVRATFPGSNRFNLWYDYSKPVTGIISNFHLTTSVKLLEYLELIKLPMHHALVKTNVEIYDFTYASEPYYWELSKAEYRNFVIVDGYVRSYQHVANSPLTFYSGWECGTSTLLNTDNIRSKTIHDLEKFQQLYPQK